MGIERFFNSLKRDYNNIVSDIMPNNKLILNSDNFFIDFNSIAHVVSQRVLGLINSLMYESILESNGYGNNNLDSLIRNLGGKEMLLDFVEPKGNEIKIVNYFKEYFNKDKIDEIIIHFISKNLLHLLSFFNKDKLKLVYIGVDGVPSKAKTVEQKKRRFMGDFDKNIKKLILENHKEELDVNRNKKTLLNKYIYLNNLIEWSRSNISPATSFMIKLDHYLNSNEFFMQVEEISKDIKLIVNGFRDDGEAEMKIIKYIRSNEINGSMCIYSPDSDVILLCLLIDKKTLIHMLRHDQQKSEKFIDPISSVYNLIKINDLKMAIYNYININDKTSKKLNLEIQKVINDIVFIFTILGDDFLHKIESFDVRNDINIILNLYQENHINILNDSYILSGESPEIKINFDNFVSLLKLMSKLEDDLIKRNFYMKKYSNYKRLTKEVSRDLKQINLFEKIDKSKLLEYEKSIKENYHNRIVSNFSGYEKEIYKYEKMLDEYLEKLNKSESNRLGDPKIEIEESRNNYYRDFFEDRNKAIQNYLDGLQWVLDYYFNDITYHKWYYLYNKSPLIKEIYGFLKVKSNDFFIKSKEVLESCCLVKSIVDLLSPFEQLLYITPFNKKFDNLILFNNYSSEEKIRNIVMGLHTNFKTLYPDIENIADKVFKSDKNNSIDCRGAIYLNKCILNVVNDSNMINEHDVKIFIRKMLSIDNQEEEYSDKSIEQKKEGIKNEYDKYKNLFYQTGEIEHKKRYKYYRRLYMSYKIE